MSTPAENLFESIDEPEVAAPAEEAAPAAEPAAPEPEAKAAPEPEKAAAPAPEPEPPAPKTVPIASLLDERREWKQRVADLESRLQAASAKPEPKPEPPKTIEFEEDPKGFIEQKVAAVHDVARGLKEDLSREQAALQEVKLMNEIAAAEKQVVASLPDWQEALIHLRQTRVQEMQTLYPDAKEQDILAAVFSSERQLAAQALASNRNPYEVAYHLAKSRGYTPPRVSDEASPAKVVEEAEQQVAQATRRLAPDTGLNAVTGSAPDDAEAEPDEETLGILKEARAERFGRR